MGREEHMKKEKSHKEEGERRTKGEREGGRVRVQMDWGTA